MKPGILLADDHAIVRQGVKSILESQGFTVIAEASDGLEAVKLASQSYPDIAVLDLSMPSLNGLDAAKQIAQVSPRTSTILLTVHTEDHYVLEAMRSRIKGYVLKSRGAENLIEAIREVLRGNVYLSPGVSRGVIEMWMSNRTMPMDPLSPRERQVLQLVAEGNSSKEIAVVLGVSAKTAESHRARIMDKLGIHETAGLVRYAIRRGLIQA